MTAAQHHERMLELAVIESPYAGDASGWPRILRPLVAWILRRRNVRYLRAAMRDALGRGEAPYASHGLYTQPGVLDDAIPAQRALGIGAGFAWARMAERAVFYVDLGWSRGMLAALERHRRAGMHIEIRRLRPAPAEALPPVLRRAA